MTFDKHTINAIAYAAKWEYQRNREREPHAAPMDAIRALEAAINEYLDELRNDLFDELHDDVMEALQDDA